MRRSKLLLPLILALLLSIVASACFASKAEELLKKAQVATRKAQSAQSTADRDENYKKAIDNYNRVIKDYKNSFEAVQARFALARIYETAKGDHKNLRGAYDAYNSLVSEFKPAGRLDEKKLDKFTPREITKLKGLIDDAEQAKENAAQKLDKLNSQKFLYRVMDFFVSLTGRIPAFSYWFAVILITLIVKLTITPLTKLQFKAMKEMQKVAPLIKEIQAKHRGDQKLIGEKTMALYKEHNINPFASCLPILIQLPILWLLYYMIRSYEFQFANGTFLWIGSALSNAYGFTVPFFSHSGKVWVTAANLAQPDLILVLLYVVSMYISTKMSAVDPTQAEQQKMMAIVMPVMFAFIFAGFPSAFLLYWLVFNVIQTVQQYLILHGGQEEAVVAGAPPPTEPEPEAEEQPEDKPEDNPEGEPRRPRRRRRRR